MNKSEFLKKIEAENLDIGTYTFEFNKITDSPFVMGCVYIDEVWKIFETTERTGHYIIKELNDESDAFDYFYELVLLQNNRS